MLEQMLNRLKDTFKNLDKKILKILNYGLKLSFLIAILSASILCTYLFFIHSDFIYQIGLAIFQISLCFAAEFVASAITVDTISKQAI